MTIGDRILVTYTSGKTREGTLVGETEKQWKVDFDGEEKRVSKNMQVELVEDEKEEEVAEEVLEPDLTDEEVDELMEAFDEADGHPMKINPEVEEPTDEEFAAPVGEPKKKKGVVVFAIILLGALVTFTVLAALGVI